MTQNPKITIIPAISEKSKNMRVAAYCRVSSESKEQLRSYASQIQYYTQLIGRHPDWILVDIYADEGLTGTKIDKRDEFLRMIDDCKKGKIDRILTKSVSRFARNTLDTIQYTRLLKKYGVSILFEADQIDTADFSSELLLTMAGARAQDESISISKNQKMNCRARMKAGEYVTNSAPYGYRLENRKLVVIPEEAKIVQLIFDQYLSGLGTYKIAEMLDERQCTKRFGNQKWNSNAIEYILKNERYIGDAIFQKTYTTDDFPFHREKNYGEVDKYYVEQTNPPIISKGKFQAVQALFEQKTMKHDSQIRHCLNKKIHCDCGYAYISVTVNEIRYWECCAHNQNAKNCNSRRIPELVIENAFISMINKLRLMQKTLLSSAIEQLERFRLKQNGMNSKIHAIDRQIMELCGQNSVLARLHTKQILSDTDYLEQSSAITQKVCLLRADRRRLLRQDENIEQLESLKELDNIITLTDCQTEFNKTLFENIVERITVPSPTTLCFELIGGLKLTEEIPAQRRRSQ